MVRKLRGRKKEGDADEDAMEAVPGGSVRRVVFESEPARKQVQRAGGKRYVPRHEASINEIEAEVDRITGGRRRRFRLQHHREAKAAESRAADRDWESVQETDEPVEKPVYRTERGSRITRAERQEADRRRRVIYLRDHDEHPREGRRFSHALVDRVIQDVDLVEEEEVEEAPAFAVEKGAKKSPKKPQKAPSKKGKAAKGSTKRPAEGTGKKAATPSSKKAGTKEAKSATKAAVKSTTKATAKRPQASKKPEQDYQPQCLAVTGSGKQCRNSSRIGSKYCASHKGYRAKGFDSHLKGKDTKPTSKKAKDTKPVEKKATGEGTDQCLALTKSGKQCRNSSQDGRKYCASHKGYRGKKAIVAGMDTKPRHAKAKDTKPSLRK